MNLQRLAEMFALVEADGPVVHRVRLVIDGEPWRVWSREELGPSWVDRAHEELSVTSQQLPRGNYSAEWIAEGKEGVRARVQGQLVGQMSSAVAKKGAAEPVAFAQAMDQVARTMQRLLETQQVQTQAMVEQLKQLHDANEALRRERDELREESGKGGIAETMLQNVAPQLGPILEVLPDVMRRYAASPPAPLRRVP